MIEIYKAELSSDESIAGSPVTFIDTPLVLSVPLTTGQYVEIEGYGGVSNAGSSNTSFSTRLVRDATVLNESEFKHDSSANRRTASNCYFAGIAGTHIATGTSNIKLQIQNASSAVLNMNGGTVGKYTLVVRVYDAAIAPTFYTQTLGSNYSIASTVFADVGVSQSVTLTAGQRITVTGIGNCETQTPSASLLSYRVRLLADATDLQEVEHRTDTAGDKKMPFMFNYNAVVGTDIAAGTYNFKIQASVGSGALNHTIIGGGDQSLKMFIVVWDAED